MLRMIFAFFLVVGLFPVDSDAHIMRPGTIHKMNCDDKQDSDGCAQYGDNLFVMGQEQLALDYYQKSCGLGLPLGCTLFALTSDSPEDVSSAQTKIDGDCDAKDMQACHLSGFLNLFLDANLERSQELFTTACNGTLEVACEHREIVEGSTLSEAQEYFEEYFHNRCDDGASMRSCALRKALANITE